MVGSARSDSSQVHMSVGGICTRMDGWAGARALAVVPMAAATGGGVGGKCWRPMAAGAPKQPRPTAGLGNHQNAPRRAGAPWLMPAHLHMGGPLSKSRTMRRVLCPRSCLASKRLHRVKGICEARLSRMSFMRPDSRGTCLHRRGMRMLSVGFQDPRRPLTAQVLVAQAGEDARHHDRPSRLGLLLHAADGMRGELTTPHLCSQASWRPHSD